MACEARNLKKKQKAIVTNLGVVQNISTQFCFGERIHVPVRLCTSFQCPAEIISFAKQYRTAKLF